MKKNLEKHPKGVWVRAGIILHTDIDPEEMTEDQYIELLKDKSKWDFYGEQVLYKPESPDDTAYDFMGVEEANEFFI